MGETKTEAGRRVVVLPPEVIKLLIDPGPGDASDWVFPSDVKTPLSSGALNDPLRRVLRRVGITKRVTVHGLRRTFNTLAMQEASGELVRKVIGHADSAMTIHYLAPDLDARRKLSTSVFGRVLKVEGRWKVPDQADSGSEATAEKPRDFN